MNLDIILRDPWVQTVDLLGHLCDGEQVGYLRGGLRSKPQAKRPDSVRVSGLMVSLIEWSTATTVTLAWRDSTRCSYGDQVWHLTRARKDGVCAISGRAIHRGEAVFKPRITRPAPINADAMILDSVLQDRFAA
jgi:hypothetical protein